MKREIEFQTVFNVRDLGGLTTADGRRVRTGVLYRSATLNRLDLVDKAVFGGLGVENVIDLRRHSEIEESGIVPEWTGATWRHHHLDHDLWNDETYSEEIGVARWLADRYLELATSGAADIAGVIALLSMTETGPSIVHCVAGKDRTGLIIALTLSLLDVPDEQIAADYALTAHGVRAWQEWRARTHPERAYEPLPPYYTQTPAEAMLMTLTELRARHGSVLDYLVQSGYPADSVATLRKRLID